MADPITTELEARSLLESAIVPNDDPTLTTAQVDQLIALAKSQNPDTSADQWTIADLNTSASLGWTWKANRSGGENFDVGVGSGKYFKLSQITEYCIAQAGRYATGILSVDGDTGTGDPGPGRGGYRSFSLQSTVYS